MRLIELARWFSRDRNYYFMYVLVTLAIMLPLLWPGYILTLDMVFTPQLPMPESITSGYLLQAALHLLNFVLPSQVIEKVLLCCILLLSGVGMHRLSAHYGGKKPSSVQEVGFYFAGILYMVNPFTYDRFMAGQYNVLLGYALLPWFVRALSKFLEQPGLRSILVLSIWALAISIASIHTVGLIMLLASLGIVLTFVQRGKRNQWKQTLKYGAMGLVVTVGLSSYWLVPLVMGQGKTASAIHTFTATNQSAFDTVGSGLVGQLGNVARLQGFWGEKHDLYLLPQDEVRFWGVIALAIIALVVTGVVSAWRSKQRFVVIWLAGSLIIASLLAVGSLSGWLTHHLPFFAGYREPQKFVGLVALGYAFFAGRGASALLSLSRRSSGQLIPGLAVLALLLANFTPVMWRGFDGQLTPRQYPADWTAINLRLNSDKSEFEVLFLPWHLYSRYQFAGRIIASPAPNFFDKPILVSSDPEFEGSSPAISDSPTELIGKQMLPAAERGDDLGAALTPMNVKYVLLAKEFDYRSYRYLDKQPHLQLVTEGPTLKLYRNLSFQEGS